MAVKRLSNGEHPAWLYIAMFLAFLVIFLHGSFNRMEDTSLSVEGADLSAGYNIGANPHASHA